MALLVVADLVRKHRDQLLGIVSLDQRVKERDPLALAESREEGVALCRTARGIDREHALQRKVHPLGIRQDGVSELSVSPEA